ncbi:hypothetical protein DFH09DRAFT_1468453 [Mycena vulgaris]|nr:hypothetical protein DFH09DRAFT_1468453 [Mycena vulgaris]
MDDRPKAPTRDLLFYKEDGDCYIRVEDIIFKIHRCHLLRGDASVFKDMFSLPSGHHLFQGLSEPDPIILAGDTPEQFRGFLSIAYAELRDLLNLGPRDLPTLINCAHFAHKYNITPLLWTAVYTGHDLMNTGHRVDWDSFLSYFELITIPGTLTLDTLATYESRIRSRWTAQLERAWSKFAAMAPGFPASHVCPGIKHDNCRKLWAHEWKRAAGSFEVLLISSSTLFVKLRQLEAELEPAFTSPCLSAAFKNSDALDDVFRSVVAEHFCHSGLEQILDLQNYGVF